MPDQLTCKYELCSDTADTAGYCYGHYGQFSRGEDLRPKRGSAAYYAARLNDRGEKLCSRCEYWLPVDQFYARYDSKTPLGRAHCNRCNTLRRMGITARQYDEMLAAQGGGCAACTKAIQPNGRQLPVDHDHSCCPGASSCGQCIRGILCDDCNVILGRAHDDPDILVALAKYLACPVR